MKQTRHHLGGSKAVQQELQAQCSRLARPCEKLSACPNYSHIHTRQFGRGLWILLFTDVCNAGTLWSACMPPMSRRTGDICVRRGKLQGRVNFIHVEKVWSNKTQARRASKFPKILCYPLARSHVRDSSLSHSLSLSLHLSPSVRLMVFPSSRNEVNQKGSLMNPP